MSLNGLFAVRKPPGLSSAQVLNTIQPLLRNSSYFKDHLISRDAPGKRTKRRRLNETKVKVPCPLFKIDPDGTWRDSGSNGNRSVVNWDWIGNKVVTSKSLGNQRIRNNLRVRNGY